MVLILQHNFTRFFINPNSCIALLVAAFRAQPKGAFSTRSAGAVLVVSVAAEYDFRKALDAANKGQFLELRHRGEKRTVVLRNVWMWLS